MEDLNKNQLILLTLLVSFVTSISTGIMTVSLLQEAPLEVTRNINRIVEKTIETVTPATVTSSGQKEVTTVVVKEEDLIIDSINKNTKSIVRIKEKNGLTSEISFYGMGLVVSKDGYIVSDRRTITRENGYTAVTSENAELVLTPVGVDKETQLLLFKVVVPEKADKAMYTFVPAALGDEPKLGQTVIGLGGEKANAISVGRATSFEMKESGTGTSTVKYLAGIDTDVSTRDLVPGSLLFNLLGNVVGIKATPDTLKTFMPTSLLKKEISILMESVKND